MSIETSIPRSWATVNLKDLLAYTYTANLNFDDETLQNEAFLFRMLRISMKYYRKITFAQKIDLFEALQFFKTDIQLSAWIMSKYIGTCKGPDKSFAMVTVNELATAQYYFNNYCETQNIDSLNMLCAVLYRPVSLGGSLLNLFKSRDIRQELKPVAERAKKFNKVPLHIRQGVYLNFRGLVNQWAKDFPLIHEQHEGDNGGFGWPGLIDDMAGDKLGTVHQVERMMAKNLLFIMEKREWVRKQQEEDQRHS